MILLIFGLRARIALTLSIIFGVLGLLLALAMIRIHQDSILSELEEHHRQQAQVICNLFERLCGQETTDEEALKNALVQVQATMPLHQVYLLKRVSNPAGFDSLISTIDHLSILKKVPRVAIRLRNGDAQGVVTESGHHYAFAQLPGIALIIAFDLAPYIKRLHTYRNLIIFYILVTTGVITIIGTVILSNQLWRPLKKLVNSVDRFSLEGVTNAWIFDEGHELGFLNRSFQRMFDAITADRKQITEQLHNLEQVNTQLTQAQDQLVRSAKLATVGRLAAGIAHEVGNPLSSILGYLELLRDKRTSPTEVSDFLARIEEEAQRINYCITELLDFARIKPELDQSTDLGALTRKTISLLSPQKRFKQISFAFDSGEQTSIAAIEPGRMQQILINLFFNAADAMEGVGTITIGITRNDSMVMLRCRDEGPGVPKELQGVIFDAFYSSKKPGAGTGLGLSICMTIVESYGGQITVVNHPEGGAEFSVSLPAVQPPEPVEECS